MRSAGEHAGVSREDKAVGVRKESKGDTPWGRRGSRGRVALVDDSRQVLDVLGMLLEELGFEVWLYEGGAAALDGLAAQAAPDAILLDVCMPGMDGWQVLGHLRERSALAGAQVFMMSAADDPGGSARAEREGAVAYLVKPFSLGAVAERIVAGRQARLVAADTRLM